MGVSVPYARACANGTHRFPRQVVREISAIRFPDASGAWLVGVAPLMTYPQPGDETLARVLTSAPDMLDPDAEREPADPYVVAMALELQGRAASEVFVVSRDKIDRPGSTSVVTACGLLGLRARGVDEFIEWVSGAAVPPEQLTLE